MSNAPTENQIQDALAVLRRDYWTDVRGLADAWREAREYAAKHGNRFEAHDALHEIVDGSERVIYTFQAQLGMLFTDNATAYEDDIGERPARVEQSMFYALIADVRETLGDEFDKASEV